MERKRTKKITLSKVPVLLMDAMTLRASMLSTSREKMHVALLLREFRGEMEAIEKAIGMEEEGK
jgi:hypothetical protein